MAIAPAPAQHRAALVVPTRIGRAGWLAVAGVVSLGHWRDWVLSMLPRLRGRVLEVGFGPGHLQLAMQQSGLRCYGLDESRFMAGQAARRIRIAGYVPHLVRGYAQQTPFPTGSFDTLVATFPAEYIFENRSLEEFRRLPEAERAERLAIGTLVSRDFPDFNTQYELVKARAQKG